MKSRRSISVFGKWPESKRDEPMNEAQEKWQQLAAKLDTELAETLAREKQSIAKSGKLILVALLLLAISAAMLVVFSNEPYALLASMPAGLLFLVTISYVIRHRRVAEHCRNDADRIRRDIRQWKKKKPNAV